MVVTYTTWCVRSHTHETAIRVIHLPRIRYAVAAVSSCNIKSCLSNTLILLQVSRLRIYGMIRTTRRSQQENKNRLTVPRVVTKKNAPHPVCGGISVFINNPSINQSSCVFRLPRTSSTYRPPKYVLSGKHSTFCEKKSDELSFLTQCHSVQK